MALPATPSQSTPTLRIVAILTGAALLAFFAWLLFHTILPLSDRTLHIDLGNGRSVALDVKNNSTDFVTILTTVMDGQDDVAAKNREIALSVLAGSYKVYQYGSDQYVDAIGNDTAPSDYAARFVELARQRRGPFRAANFIDLDDRAEYEKIDTLPYTHPFLAAIRKRVLDGSTLLWPEDHSVQVYESADIAVGTAAVCTSPDSEYRGNSVSLFKPTTNTRIVVFGKFPLQRPECATDPNGVIQINPIEARTLVGGSHFSGPESAYAKAEPKQYTAQPITPRQAQLFNTVVVESAN